jgi:hypothetical protein
MAAPRTEDWYYCPTCGSKVQVGSAGCINCAADQHDESEFGDWDCKADSGFVKIPAGYAEKDEEPDYAELITQGFPGASRNSINPVAIAVALAVFLVALFLILAAQNS